MIFFSRRNVYAIAVFCWGGFLALLMMIMPADSAAPPEPLTSVNCDANLGYSSDVLLAYEQERFPFVQLIHETIYPDAPSLDRLHEVASQDYCIPQFHNDSDTEFHIAFYRRMKQGWPEFLDAYHSFIRRVVAPVMRTDTVIFQKWPNIRIMLPNNQAVVVYHRDSDELHQHPDGELNFIVALTEMYDTNTIVVESLPFLGDFHPVKMSPGQALLFNGNKCRHGNEINLTGKTRVSFDFRVIPQEAYDVAIGQNKRSAIIGTKFRVGGYYDILTL